MARPSGTHTPSKLLVPRIKELKAAGLSLAEIGETLGVTRNTVTGLLWRDKHPGVRSKPNLREVPAPPIVLPPPSRALIALAEFDPVMARALKKREAETPLQSATSSRES